MWSSIDLIVSIGSALTRFGLDHRRSQLLPTAKTSSMEFKYDEYRGTSSTKNPLNTLSPLHH